MRLNKRQLRRLIREEKARIIKEQKSRLLEKRILKENPVALLLGGGLIIALGSKGGRSLIAKILRINGQLLDKFETIDDRLADVLGKDYPILDELSELAAEMNPVRMSLDAMADLLDGLSDEEGEALNQALEPVKMGTSVGRIAKGTEMIS